MSLTTAQVYSVNEAGVLTAIPNFIFKTDSTGSAILGGCCSDITSTEIRSPNYYTDYIDPRIATDGFGQYNPFETKGTSSAIVGGANNCTLDSEGSFIGAGQDNFISGRTLVQYVGSIMGTPRTLTLNHGSRNFIGGGTANTVCSSKSVIVGGHGNMIKGVSFCYGQPWNLPYSTTISGEYADRLTVLYSSDGFGLCNIKNGPGYNGIVGGKNNCINAIYSIIGGGFNNRIISDQEVVSIGGGYGFLGSNNSGKFDFIGGGCNNTVANTCSSIIVGGRDNCLNLSNDSSLVGGRGNFISGSSEGNSLVGGIYNKIIGGSYQFIGGGIENIIFDASCSALVGGSQNSIISNRRRGRDADVLNIIAGGCNNIIIGGCSSIIGGSDNTIDNTICSSIIAGSNSTITATCGTILGGQCVVISHTGAAMIGDHTERIKNSVGKDTLTLDFVSGTYIKNKIIFQNDNYIPSTSTSFGISGQIVYDSNYHYRHDGKKWKRTVLSEF
jgi:hypothetical protein